jgi:hypothetical protein
VTATYRFHNPTDARIEVQVGFPETPCHEDQDCAGKGGGRFRNLATEVRGAPVTMREGKVRPGARWARDVGRVYLFDLAFEPGETVTVVHRYDYDVSTDVDGWSVDYLTRTGSLWSGPIGSARFVIRTLDRPWGIRHPGEFTMASHVERVESGRPVTEVVFEAKDWKPRGDLMVHFDNAMAMGNCHESEPRCPMRLLVSGEPASMAADFADLSGPQLRTCRNLVFAHHGYRFESADLAKTFYRPSRGRVACGYGKAGPHGACRCVAFVENPEYSPALLTPAEQRWVDAIREEESRRASSAKPGDR